MTRTLACWNSGALDINTDAPVVAASEIDIAADPEILWLQQNRRCGDSSEGRSMGAVVVDDRMRGVLADLRDHHRQARAEAGASCGQGASASLSRRYAGIYLMCTTTIRDVKIGVYPRRLRG